MASTASPADRIGFLGPSGTFTEQALLTQPDLAAAKREPTATIAGALRATDSGDVDFGFVPIENALEGTVNHTIDTLAFNADLLIQREVDLPISMQLIAPEGTALGALRTVHSHPMAIGQCREWLTQNLPDVELVTTDSTATAVSDVAAAANGGADSDGTTAAIANSLAADLYGLSIIAADIADNSTNLTRFVLVGRDGIPAATGHDKTSIVVFQRADRPGSLLAILQEFAARSINLSKLESRPTKTRMGDYCFILDLDGHISDELVADCLRNLHAKQGEVKFLGSYPAIGAGAEQARVDVDEAWQQASSWMDSLRGAIEAG